MSNVKDFTSYLQPELEKFEWEFKDYLKSGIFLIDQINRFIAKGQGKKFRPILTFLSAKLVGKATDLTVKAALIVELLHNATLVHDDVVDDSDKRRGLPSIKKIWNNKIAVLYGDYLLAHSFTAMLELRDLRVFDILTLTSRRLAKGELNQAVKARKFDMTEAQYLNMIADKTAALTSASAELGALSGGGSEDQQKALRGYGENLGMAFQIRDDILDFSGRAGILGKPIGSDIKEGKLTLPLIYTLNSVNDGYKSEIIRDLKEGEFKKILKFVNNSEGIEFSQRKALSYSESAKEHLAVFPESPEKILLCQLANYSVEREK
jgi:octaprenyl-diphosphate synthase